ncbi:MAG: cytochrome c maturation protein CcmE [Dehalococcoidia bacterium]|nr:cytochrome c maturation protein CcmE [Dehalococcoidia bacterium]
MLKKKKFLISGLIVFLAIAYLGFVGFRSSATFYYTVSELQAKGDSVKGQNLRVNGLVAPGSVQTEEGGFVLKFTVTEGGKDIPVFYRGTVPDTFKAGNEVVAEGHIDSAGIFQANTIMPKCPSKYVPE